MSITTSRKNINNNGLIEPNERTIKSKAQLEAASAPSGVGILVLSAKIRGFCHDDCALKAAHRAVFFCDLNNLGHFGSVRLYSFLDRIMSVTVCFN